MMEECNKRGINVILDLVVNHTSTKHPWFLKEFWQERIYKVKSDYIDANFLSNHDTDRYFGVIGKDSVKQKMAASMYLMMPGNSFTYYGEEIGMLGSGHDANKRAPMVWSTQSNEEMATPIPESDNIPAIEKGVKEQEKEKAILKASEITLPPMSTVILK